MRKREREDAPKGTASLPMKDSIARHHLQNRQHPSQNINQNLESGLHSLQGCEKKNLIFIKEIISKVACILFVYTWSEIVFTVAYHYNGV